MPEKHFLSTGGLVFGLVVIALGVLFTLENLGVVEAGEILRWWPAALLAYGLARLTGLWCRRNFTAGLILTLIGAVFLLYEIGFLWNDPWDFWPVILIILGASMVTKALRRERWAGPDRGPGTESSSWLNTTAILSSVDRRLTSPDFRGGTVTSVLGSADIDLRGARMAGGTATLDLTVFMGSAEIHVPEDWRVAAEVSPVLGSVDEHTRPPAGEAAGNLILKGTAALGSVEIRN
jgi:predicted membrane protein